MFVNLTQVGASNAGPKRIQSSICKVTRIDLARWVSTFSLLFKPYEKHIGIMVSHVNFEIWRRKWPYQDCLKYDVQRRCEHIFTQALLLPSCKTKRAAVRSDFKLTLLLKFCSPQDLYTLHRSTSRSCWQCHHTRLQIPWQSTRPFEISNYRVESAAMGCFGQWPYIRLARMLLTKATSLQVIEVGKIIHPISD